MMKIDVGSTVLCCFAMRRSKTYSRFGEPARDGDQGIVLRINELKGVSIVEFETPRGKVHAHIQNLVDK
jgi:hypothetical protein